MLRDAIAAVDDVVERITVFMGADRFVVTGHARTAADAWVFRQTGGDVLAPRTDRRVLPVRTQSGIRQAHVALDAGGLAIVRAI